MTRGQINRIAAVVPLLLAALAFAIVIGNILAGVPPQPDEDASAHLWQLLMVTQIPLILLFALTADWRRWTAPLLLVAQVAAMIAAAVPVWLAGY